MADNEWYIKLEGRTNLSHNCTFKHSDGVRCCHFDNKGTDNLLSRQCKYLQCPIKRFDDYT